MNEARNPSLLPPSNTVAQMSHTQKRGKRQPDPDELRKAEERLKRARSNLPATAPGTRDDSIEMFSALRDRAIAEGQMNAAVMAETNRAKLAGLLQPESEKAEELEKLSDAQLRLRLGAAMKKLGYGVGKPPSGRELLDVAAIELKAEDEAEQPA